MLTRTSPKGVIVMRRRRWSTPPSRAELFLYPGDVHLFADSSLPSYDQQATELMTGRILESLSAIDS